MGIRIWTYFGGLWRLTVFASAVIAVVIVLRWYWLPALIPASEIENPFSPAVLLLGKVNPSPIWLLRISLHSSALLILVCASAALIFLGSSASYLVRDLALAFGVGSMSLSLFGFVTPVSQAQHPWSLLLNATAVAAFLYALYRLPKFFGRYPRTIQNTEIATSLQNGRVRLLARLSKIAPRVFVPDDPPDSMLYQRAHPAAIYNVLDSPRLFALLLTNGILLAILWETRPGLASFGLFMFVLFATFLSIFNAYTKLRSNYLSSRSDDRGRLQWIHGAGWIAAMFLAIAIIVSLILDTFIIDSGVPDIYGVMIFVVPNIAAIIFVFGLLVSVLYRGDIDPALAVRKSAIYSLIALVFAAGFVAVETVLESQIVARLGLPAGNYSGIIAGILAALAVAPIRNRIERLVDTLANRGTRSE